MNVQAQVDGNEKLPKLESQALAERIAELAVNQKALDVKVLRVRELVHYTDWFVICSGRSDRQVNAICEHMVVEVKKELGLKPLSREGAEHGQWVLVDFGDVVAHVFFEPVREYYQLENLWGEAPELELPEPEGHPATQGTYAV